METPHVQDELAYHASGFFVLRTPLLPFDEFLNWGEGLEVKKADGDPAQFQQLYNADCSRLRNRLRDALTREEVQEALFLASPNVIERFNLWMHDPDSKAGRKLEQVLVRYFARMCGRATPFGLFAGISVGILGEQTELLLEERSKYRRQTRFDRSFLLALTDSLSRTPALRETFVYRPNSSLYHIFGRVHYVTSRFIDGKHSYQEVVSDDTRDLAATLALASEGVSLVTLIDRLIEIGIAPENARTYVEELVSQQILVADLALNITGPEPTHALIQQLDRHEKTRELAGQLKQASEQLEAIDVQGLGTQLDRYRKIAHELSHSPVSIDMSRLFQVDMFKPAVSASLGSEVLDEMIKGAEILRSLSAPSERDMLRPFREAFARRYEKREVPIVEALDQEYGVGLEGCDSDESFPLLKSLVFPSSDDHPAYGTTSQGLFRMVSASLQCGLRELVLDGNDLEMLCVKESATLPDSFEVAATLVAASQKSFQEGNFRLILRGVSGPSGVCHLSRFCHADETLRQHVLNHLRAEESLQPDAIFAEIVHLPEGHVGNVVSRPLLRDYEIPYLARSGAASDCQIPLTDLLISLQDERIILRSARLGCEVIPRLTNAHDFGPHHLKLYRFLCLLQQWKSLAWDWGPFSNAPFLPRVTTGRIVLSLARWTVGRDELHALGQPSGAALFRAVQAWRTQRHLPRLIALVEGDKTLPVDLDNPLSIDSFIQHVKHQDAATLIEIYPSSAELCVSSPEGHFVHEMIVPFNLQANRPEARQRKNASVDHPKPLPDLLPISPGIVRRFTPGSEWLFVKLYTGPETADHLLRTAVASLVNEMVCSEAIVGWFFIRYEDPDHHLRLRFQGAPQRLQREVLPALRSAILPLLDDGRIWRMQLDTYEREVERYGGGKAIELAERIFRADSDAVLKILGLLGNAGVHKQRRWLLAVLGIDTLLQDFGFDLEGKHRLMRRLNETYAREFKADKRLRDQLSTQYRAEGKRLQALLTEFRDGGCDWSPAFALKRRSEELAAPIADLKRCSKSGQLSLTLEQVTASFLHMYVNRLLRSSHRAQELVLYFFLTRLYESQMARDR